MRDLLNNIDKNIESNYNAEDIEVLEGLEPVRRRPGMYIGGTDENAYHHLFSEVFDNCMDEVGAGFASYIDITLNADGSVTIADNGRGIPIEAHPKFPDKSTLELVLTTLHSGGKFSNKLYETSGGLHGVGISVVNALSQLLIVEVTRNGVVWRQEYSKGYPKTALTQIAEAKKNQHGTKITFYPDKSIFDEECRFKPIRLYKLVKSKAYLFKGVQIKWHCDPSLISAKAEVPEEDIICFPNGLKDYLSAMASGADLVTPEAFTGEGSFEDKKGRIEWALYWLYGRDYSLTSYCNTVPTEQGGTHENGLKSALLRALKDFGELSGNKKAAQITAEDILNGLNGIVSLFIPNPQFQGQTKDKLTNKEVAKLVENSLKDHFDHWLIGNKNIGNELLNFVIERAEERISRRHDREISRKNLVQRLRLPGKLTDCVRQNAHGAEIFLVEGDSAGGSAKMARNRENQAILPLRGKVLNVASATKDKIIANQEIADLILALGCGTGKEYDDSLLRYERVVIMTDADVDGAHIASLLMTCFYILMPELINNNHLYLAKPPLYRLNQGNNIYYASDEEELERLKAKLSKGKSHIDVGRFKGLGEMTPSQLRETTMNPANRTLLKVQIHQEDRESTATRVEELMGKKPELRFKFIKEQSQIMGDKLNENLDV